MNQRFCLHPDNPRYFLFRGKPTILMGSGEHYGIIINSDFDYATYLRALQRDGLNHTRAFSGFYYEPPGSFNIVNNTQGVDPSRYLGPWARVEDEEYKFDLTRWEPTYFDRLHRIVQYASDCGIIVEMVLFCVFYEDSMWDLSPMNARNNVNGLPQCKRTEAFSLSNKLQLDLQILFTRKMMSELMAYDNVYFEAINEPYITGGVPADWESTILDTMADCCDESLPPLLARNIQNHTATVTDPHPAVSIYNFHYATPPDAVADNWGLNRPIADDETGFRGTNDFAYRHEAWDFLLAGGSVYSNLDFSFTVENPDGTAPIPADSPGGGGPRLRSQLAGLKKLFDRVDFLKMTPANDLLGPLGEGVVARCFAQSGVTTLAYLRGSASPGFSATLPPADRRVTAFSLILPSGDYRVTWIDPKTMEEESGAAFSHAGGAWHCETPEYCEDIALIVQAAT